MEDPIGRGWLGSLRKRVADEVKIHLSDNPTLRRTRYSLPRRLLGTLLADRSVANFLIVYLILDFVMVAAEGMVSVCNAQFVPHWTGDAIKGLLTATAGYLITAQAGILAIVSVAIGLVTLIAQRSDGVSASTDIRLYYVESLAYEVVSTSVALLVVLVAQILWPLQFLAHHLGIGGDSLFFKAVLTGIHVVWLSANLAAFALFVTTSLRFVEPKARERIRERYLANIVIPRDVAQRMFRHLVMQVTNRDDGPFLMLGRTSPLTDGGETELATVFHRPFLLHDIRLRPLGWALRAWWWRVKKAGGDARRGPGRTATLSLSPSFESEYEGQVEWCHRRGGVPLTKAERWLVRRSFVFRAAPRREPDDMPTPADILDELADRVAGAIERSARTGFRQALDEMVRYHRFLLQAHDTRSAEGDPFSLAQIGGLWAAPHQEWIRQYRRVYEKAAARLGEETEFARTVSHLPMRLLPDDATAVSPAIVTSILDLAALEVVFLEHWCTRRTSVEVAEGASAEPRLVLAGSDQRAYQEVVFEFIGAWEDVLRMCSHHYGWARARQGTPARRWDAFSKAWPFLEKHLHTTAYVMASAVWNEDTVAADRYRDMLLRWPEAMYSDLEDDWFLDGTWLLLPHCLSLRWPDAEARLSMHMRGPHRLEFNPGTVFGEIVRHAFDDVIVLTAAVTLAWFAGGQQSTDIGGRTAAQLFRREAIEDGAAWLSEGSGRPVSPLRRTLHAILRSEIGGAPRDQSYGGSLDGLVRQLNGMSERRVVPGRVYATSRRNGRDALAIEFLALLLAALPDGGDDGLVAEMDALAAGDTILEEGDAALRRIVSELTQMQERLSHQPNRAVLDRCLRVLVPEADTEARIGRLQTILADSLAAIERRRDERLEAAPLDQSKMDSLRSRFEQVLTNLPGILVWLEGVRTERLMNSGSVDEERIGVVDKGELTAPRMNQPALNFDGVLTNTFSSRLVNRVWAEFFDRERTVIPIDDNAPVIYWRTVRKLAGTVGASPTLLVSSDRAQEIFTWQYQREEQPTSVGNVDYTGERGGGYGARYVARVDGIAVFSTNMQTGRSILFSGTALNSVSHAPIDESGSCVELAFHHAGDPREGAIVARFSISLEWNASPVLELVAAENPPAPGNGGSRGVQP